jgi:hypothetical protein
MASSIVAFASNPSNWQKASDCAKGFNQDELSRNLSAIAQVAPIALGIVGIRGRFKVGDIWTPDGVPGPDKIDVVIGRRRQKNNDAA